MRRPSRSRGGNPGGNQTSTSPHTLTRLSRLASPRERDEPLLSDHYYNYCMHLNNKNVSYILTRAYALGASCGLLARPVLAAPAPFPLVVGRRAGYDGVGWRKHA
eukprot:scaffold61692_cov73-Phaeocystis_antarctica.AAC.7